MNEQIKFYKGTKLNLPNPGEPGAIYHCLDTKETYLCLADGSLTLYSTGLTPSDMEQAINDAINLADANEEFHGVSASHSWEGTVLTITSAAGTTSADLRGPVGDSGVYIGSTEPTDEDDVIWLNPEGIVTSPEDLKGPKGDPGDTYVLTEQDKNDIINIILDLIPRWEGGEF